MKFEAVTIKDIAKALGLSTSTVSRALRDSYEISPETKQLVLECAKRMNYSPNPIALSLKEKKSRTIAVVVCEIANNFFSQVINGIEVIAYNKGYNVIISQSHESYEREVLELKNLASRSIDGLLISLSTETNDIGHLKELYGRGLPIVLFDRISKEINTHSVIADNFKGAYEATQHLIKNGYKNIAAITTSEFLSITTERLNGYKKALIDNKIEVNDSLIRHTFYGGMNLDEVDNAINKLFDLKTVPDAIFTTSDKLTSGCLKILQKKKLRVPEDVALVGFSNTNNADLFNPSLTVVRQPALDIGKEAAKLLLEMIESKRPVQQFEQKVFSPELEIRDSSSPKITTKAKRR